MAKMGGFRSKKGAAGPGAMGPKMPSPSMGAPPMGAGNPAMGFKKGGMAKKKKKK